MKTLLCVPITASTPEAMAREIEAAAKAGADMIELRLDCLEVQPWEEWDKLSAVRQFKGNVILTCRVAEEGGQYCGDDDLRAKLLRAVMEKLDCPVYLDVEFARLRQQRQSLDLLKLARALAKDGLILSRHDFRGTPTDVSALLAEMPPEYAVLKLACKANTIIDSFRVLDALHEWAPKRPTIALAMGEAGLITRVLAKKLGAFLTFASLEAGKESAPGQPTIKDMRELYRWDKLNADTQVYGVIGCPVAHSMSPAIHNAAFEAVGHNGVYLPLLVEPDYASFAAFVDGCQARPWLDFRGCSVTIPHKENLLRYVEQRGGEIEPLARRLGVANTLCVSPRQPEAAGSRADTAPLYACNTDWAGALDALCTGTGIESDGLKDLRVAVLGAGGAARAIVAGLCDSGCTVTIYNRTPAKAKTLAEQFGATARPWDERGRIEADVIVNGTSIGMSPNDQETPLPQWPDVRRLVVFDTVYNPLETRLLREARERAYQTVDGLKMLVGQAARQFTLWTGRPAPVELMDRVARDRLTRRTG